MKIHPGTDPHVIYDACIYRAGVMDFSATAARYAKDPARESRYRTAETRLERTADAIYGQHHCPGCYQWNGEHESGCIDGERIAREAWLQNANLTCEAFPASEDMPDGSARVSYNGVQIGYYTANYAYLTVYVGYDRDASGQARRYMNMGNTEDMSTALNVIRAHAVAPAAAVR